jgi:formylglycine-generating enzyme
MRPLFVSTLMATGLMVSMTFADTNMASITSFNYQYPFRSSGARESTFVKSFRIDKYPVTVQSFLNFIKSHPTYSKSRIIPLFSDSLYLSSWENDSTPPLDRLRDPITEVSLYAAKAYCNESGKRLPTTPEWEHIAKTIPLGQDSAKYQADILDWYAKPTMRGKVMGQGSLNAYGVFDLYGKIWEWTSDFNAGGPRTASADQGKADSFFCGGAGQATADGVDYATFMRFSFRSSLKPNFSVGSLGFRCAQDE